MTHPVLPLYLYLQSLKNPICIAYRVWYKYPQHVRTYFFSGNRQNLSTEMRIYVAQQVHSRTSVDGQISHCSCFILWIFRYCTTTQTSRPNVWKVRLLLLCRYCMYGLCTATCIFSNLQCTWRTEKKVCEIQTHHGIKIQRARKHTGYSIQVVLFERFRVHLRLNNKYSYISVEVHVQRWILAGLQETCCILNTNTSYK